MTKKKHILGIVSLVLCSMIWGTAFVAQRVNPISPYWFNAIRNIFAIVALIPVICVCDWISGKPVSVMGDGDKRTLIWGGLCCGSVLGISALLQQWGLQYVSAGIGGFLTALYIVLVPVFGLLFHRRTHWFVCCAVAISLIGTYLLAFSGKNGNDVAAAGSGNEFAGQVAVLLSAFGFAGHILVIDYFAARTDVLRLSGLQFVFSGFLSLVIALLLREPLSTDGIRLALPSLLYCGILSSSVAYTLQMIGQKYVAPTAGSLLMSMESVFSVLAGWLFLRETLSVSEMAGCGLIFTAVILAQLHPEHS